jgi:hypothetical protein
VFLYDPTAFPSLNTGSVKRALPECCKTYSSKFINIVVYRWNRFLFWLIPAPMFILWSEVRMAQPNYSFYTCRRMFALLAALFFSWQSPDAGAQSSKVGAILEGTVMDSSHAVIPGAGVTLRNTSTNQTREMTTDGEGLFHADALPVGTYEVRVVHPGFASYHHTGVDLTLGQNLRLDIVLAPASSSEEITVNAQPPAIDPTQTSVVSSVDGERIEELPVRSRNSLDFVLLAPGVTNSPAAPPGERSDAAQRQWLHVRRPAPSQQYDLDRRTRQQR